MSWSTAWWVLWHPLDALFVCLIALLWLIAPELVLIWLLLAMHNPPPRRRVVQGAGFTMRDP